MILQFFALDFCCFGPVRALPELLAVKIKGQIVNVSVINFSRSSTAKTAIVGMQQMCNQNEGIVDHTTLFEDKTRESASAEFLPLSDDALSSLCPLLIRELRVCLFHRRASCRTQLEESDLINIKSVKNTHKRRSQKPYFLHLQCF